ncbi:MAG: hypothetical protein H0T57_02685 [Rubrobacter sp.]|nr:hypothetical protein [Rubrobacter sp.]
MPYRQRPARGGDVQDRGGEIGRGLTRAGGCVGQQHAALLERLLHRPGEHELLGTVAVAALAGREGTGIGEERREAFGGAGFPLRDI